jgi:arginine N-succinyltransferase
MPKHPIYALLLSPEARAVMGKVHAQTLPALHLLERENFRMQGYIDIFDGGPTVEAPLPEIRSIKRSRLVKAEPGQDKNPVPHLVANTKLDEFRCLLADLSPSGMSAPLSKVQLEALRVKAGDSVRVTVL